MAQLARKDPRVPVITLLIMRAIILQLPSEMQLVVMLQPKILLLARIRH